MFAWLHFRRLVLLAAIAAVLSGTHLAAQHASFPRPDSARPPLLTWLPPDSIRYHTAYLHLMELLQVLQLGDAASGNRLLEGAVTQSPCGSITDAISRITTSVRRVALSSGGASYAVFFDNIKIIDSTTKQLVTLDLVVLPLNSGAPTRSAVTLSTDPALVLWTNETGLLDALCRL